MSDLNWCTYCDTAINHYSESLYCSEECLKCDALAKNPLLGYEWEDFIDFPRPFSQHNNNNNNNNNNSYKTQAPKSNSSLLSVARLSHKNEKSHYHSTTNSRNAIHFDPSRTTPSSSTISSSASASSYFLTPSSSSSSPSPSLSSSSSNSSSIYGSPALTTACSTVPNSPNSSYYSSALPSSKFDVLPFVRIGTENNNKLKGITTSTIKSQQKTSSLFHTFINDKKIIQ